MLEKIVTYVSLLSIFTIANNSAIELKATKPPPPKISAKFLLAVNDTWDPKG